MLGSLVNSYPGVRYPGIRRAIPPVGIEPTPRRLKGVCAVQYATEDVRQRVDVTEIRLTLFLLHLPSSSTLSHFNLNVTPCLSPMRDSNSRPTGSKPVTLSAELIGRNYVSL